MVEKLDEKQLVEFKELLMSGVIQSEALINLLDRKGIISKHELLEEMKKVDSDVIGDPYWGCGKNYVAEWRCGNEPKLYRTVVQPDLNQKITLKCP